MHEVGVGFQTDASVADVSCCSLLRPRDQSRSLRCGWEIGDHRMITAP